jgi:DNA-binding transcriptional ArsR family regulator
VRTPPLLPLLRSQTQGSVLTLLFLHPEREYTLSEIARLVGASVGGVQHEVSRLVEGGLLVDRRVGNARLVRADTDTLLARPLTDLLLVSYGPVPVLSDTLADVPGVERAFIHGSWAARHAGEAGPLPNDVDVLVVGTADRDALEDVAEEAGRTLRRDVNVRRVSPQAWSTPEPDDAFLSTVKQNPLVELTLGHGPRGGDAE